MRRRLPVVVSLALALVLATSVVTAGAQSDGTDGAATTTAPADGAPATTVPATGAPAAGTRGVTATSIKVGGLAHSFLYGDADIGAKARFQRANDAGGVNGRTIDYLGLTDDGGDPNLDAQAAAKVVEQDQVFAVVPTVTPDLSGAKYLVRQQVPYFGWALSSNFCGNEYGFGFNGCLVSKGVTSNAWGVLVAKAFAAAKVKGTKAAAILTENTPSGQYQLASLTAGLRSAKLKVVYAQTSLAVPATADYGAVAKAVLTSNGGKAPESVFVVGNISNVLGVQQALRTAGFLGVFTNQLEYAPDLVAPSAGAFVMLQTAPPESAATNPAIAQMVADVQKVAPGQPVTQALMAGYWSADLFLAAVQKAGKNLTTARLLKAVNTKFTYKVAKTVGPTTFPAAHSQPSPCGALVTSNGTAYAVNVPYTCGAVVPVKPSSR
jgi:branched-chain amino acid transport system substrate-binding protein